MKNFYEIIEKDMDHNYIKKENKFYNCNKCKCFFKYNSCLDYLKNFFTNYNNITNYLFHFNNKEYLIQILSEINNENKEKLDLIKFNNNFKDIYNYHQNENIYLHNNKIGHNKYFIIYPSNLLLFPLKETFFFFFFFFSHAESVNISLSVKWCKFNKDIFIEGESKNSNIKITHNKNLNVKNVDNKKEQKERNYIGICSGLFYFNVENLNDLEISYEFCEMDNSEFEYNYFKKKYIMIFNCNVKLDCYYKDFYSFIKINNIKYIKSECNLKKNSLNYQNSEPNLSEVSKEDNKIHGCIIMNGSNLNHIGGKDIKRHEYRLLLFYDDNITKDKNFLNLRFSIKLKHFYNNEIIKVSSYFYIHTFDFLLINENNLLLSIFYYLKKKLLIEEKKNSLEEYNNKSKTAEYDNKKQMNSFVDEMLEELNFIKKEEFNEEKKDNNTTNILNEDFKKIKNYFDIEEYVLLEFQNFIYKMENESKKKMQIKEQCEENSLRYHFSEKKEYIFKNVQNEKQKINYYEEFINQNKFYQKDYNKDKIINDNIINFIWKYILLKKLNNKIGYDFIDFIRKHKYELYYSYEKKDIIRENECMKKEKKEKISKQKVLTNLCKNYCYELNRENDIIYIIITNTNKYNLKLNFDSNHYINDTINKIFHYCINDLILKKEWNGISEFINEYKLNKNKKKKYKNINIKTLNSQSYNKLKHLNFIYKERNKDYYYKYLDQILKEKNDYCLNLKNNFFLDFFIFKNKINSMKSSFVKLSLYCDNINFYEDEITMNLNKSEKICKIFITSKIKSLHLLNPYKITKDEDKCIFLNCLYVDYEILKNYEEVNKVEKNEKIEQICKCFDEILKPYEIIIFNSCNLKKNITWSFSKIFYKNKKNTELKYEGETTKTNQEKTQKTENNVNENINEKEINEENNIHTEKFLNSSNNINFRNEDCELKIDSMNSCINTKEKKKIKIFLENILHKEGNHLYKIKCNYEYIDDNSLNNRIKNDVSNYTINEDLKKLLFLDFYLYINIEKPQIMLLYNNQVYYDKKIKFDFNYFNKKAYKKINKMYKSQIINDIIYEDMNEINKYFDIIFLKNKNLKLYFINQQDIHFFTYIYTKKFFVIKNIYIDNEEFDHSNTHIFNIKRKCNVCIELEIDELKFKNEIKNNMNNSSTLKNNISKKLIYEDFLIFQYLTSKNQQKFLIECHYNVSFIILKENKYIFHEFNNLKRKDQGINSKELNDIENNLLDNIKKGKIIYNEIEVKNNIYFIYIHFTELKIYKFCLFLFNTTKIPATWNIKENSSNLISSSLKNINSKIFHFSKTKGILFGETYDIHSVNSNKYEKKKNPFLFPDYLIVTFEPISKSDITKKYCINIADGEKIYFYLKAIYQQKND